MIKDLLDIKSVLISFEGVLGIDYMDDISTKQTLDDALSRIEQTYDLVIDRDLFSMQTANNLIASKADILLHDITDCLKTMSLYKDICMFTKSVGISLADVNYLGNDKNVLCTLLRYLQDESEADKWKSALEPVIQTLDNVSICIVKRLFIIMIMLHKLGINEGVSIIAQYLYLGGLTV